MTAKRFTNDWSDEFEREVITDHHNSDYEMFEKEACELLNELHETNEQLQHDATILIQANQDYRRENEQLNEKIKREIKHNQRLHSDNCELHEENERLKGEIQGFIKGIQETAKVSADGIMKNYQGEYE